VKKLVLLALGAAAVAYVVARRRAATASGSENGNPLASSQDVRRAVGEARQRIEADAENA
jgi:alkylation response protein AidB-like acyl-CoA dehydrogenase